MFPNAKRDWWSEKWWLKEEYAGIYLEKVTSEQVDRAISRVAEVYDSEWGERTARHPAYGWLLAEGLMPLQFLYGLGRNLLELDGSLRLPSVINDLRNPANYESARFELEIAAHLKKRGHTIEFRPPLPNGRRSDFAAVSENERVSFEIKRLQESQTQLALHRLTQSIAFALSGLTSESGHPALKGKGFRVDLDAELSLLLGSNPETDMDLVEGIKNQIIGEVLGRVESLGSLEFVIPSTANVHVGDMRGERSSVNCPSAPSASELRRIVSGRLQDAIDQLHPEYPGIIMVQTPGGLELDMTQAVLGGLLAQFGSRASHLSAVVLFPVFYSFPTTWANFRPFAVANRGAKIQVHSLKAFDDLKLLLELELRTPGG